MGRFRRIVDAIPSNSLDSHLIKTLYLLANRNSEVITKSTKWDIRHDQTKPYGQHLKYSFKEFKVDEKTTEKVFLIQSAIAKRSKKRLTLKLIALPTNPIFEPWTLDLMKRLMKTGGNLSFPISRFRVNRIVKKWFWEKARMPFFKPVEHPEKEKGEQRYANPLRHIRITHLDSFYAFEPTEMITYAGWSYKAGLRGLGFGSGQLDTYLHAKWRKYFPKLLKRLA